MSTPRRLWVGTLWIILLTITLGIFITQNTAPTPASDDEPMQPDTVGVKLMELQARYMIGARQTLVGRQDAGSRDLDPSAAAVQGDALYMQVAQLNNGSVDQRLRAIVTIAEFRGAEFALGALDELEVRLSERLESETLRPPHLTEDHRQTIRVLRALFLSQRDDGPGATALDEADRQHLVDSLGWFGELALHPVDGPDPERRDELLEPARTLTLSVVIGAIGGIAVGALGFFGLAVMVVLLLLNKLRSRIEIQPDGHGVYLETFIVWLVLFSGVLAAMTLLPAGIDSLVATGVGFFLSLVALAWPKIRGRSWATIRRDIGLHRGQGVVVEFASGVAGYVMGLPLLLIGLLMTLALMGISGLFAAEGPGDPFGGTGGPAHPIIAEAGSSVAAYLRLIFVASLAAPIVEEIMFRGVFYRHLRTVSWRLGMFGSIALSCLVNSVIFAAIHPQGWVAIPALASLAISMSLLREWRGSLIAPITLHAVSNGLVMTLVWLAFSSM